MRQRIRKTGAIGLAIVMITSIVQANLLVSYAETTEPVKITQEKEEAEVQTEASTEANEKQTSNIQENESGTEETVGEETGTEESATEEIGTEEIGTEEAGTGEEVTTIEEAGTEEIGTDEITTEEAEQERKELVTLRQNAAGYEVQITAEAGVLPAECSLSVSQIDKSTEIEKIENAIEESLMSQKQIDESISFDITILDKEGNEVQPDNSKGELSVSFKNVEVTTDEGEEKNIEIYHVADDYSSVENIDTIVKENQVEINAEHFSTYTIVFTSPGYKDYHYNLLAGTSLKISELLTRMGVSYSTITDVSSVDTGLLSITNSGGEFSILGEGAGSTTLQVIYDGSTTLDIAISVKEAAYSGTCGANGDNLIWALTVNEGDSSKYTLTISGTGDMANYTYLGAPWHSNRTKIAEIVLGNGITHIGNHVFFECSSLTNMELPTTVTSIGELSFQHCINLASIKIPYGVTIIGNQAFLNCSNLTSIELPDSVTSIGSYAFSECGLTSITIPDSVISLGGSAFYKCTKLTSIELSSKLTSIGAWIFWGCSKLKEIKIPYGVTSIGSLAFQSCSSLTSIEIPSSVTSLEYAAFRSCSSLTSIVIPSSVTSIGGEAFSGCSGINEIVIPNGVTSIGLNAFEGWDSNSIIYNLSNVDIGTTSANEGTVYFVTTKVDGIFTSTTKVPANDLSIVNINSPDKEGYVFCDWYTDSAFTTKWTGNGEIVTSNIELFAKFKKILNKNDIKVIKNNQVTVYDGLSKEVPVTVTLAGYNPNGVSPVIETASATAVLNSTNAGIYTSYTLTSIQLPENSNYTVTDILSGIGIDNDDKDNFGVNIDVANALISIAQKKETIHKIYGDETIHLTGITNNVNAEMLYKSGNPAVATVDTTGKVTITGAGTCGITVSLPESDNYTKAESKIITLTVAKKVLSSISNDYQVPRQTETNYSFDLLKLLPNLGANEQYENLTYTIKSITNDQGVLKINPKSEEIAENNLPLQVASVADKDKTATIIIGINSDDYAIADATIFVKTVDSDTESTTDTSTEEDKPIYKITVKNGTANPVTAVAGETVTITANKVNNDKVFDKWSTSKGVTLTNTKSKKTTFIMPANNVTITAKYKDDSIQETESVDVTSSPTETSDYETQKAISTSTQSQAIQNVTITNKEKIKVATMKDAKGNTIAGWEAIIKEVGDEIKEFGSDITNKANIQDAYTITIELNEETVVQKEILEAIKGKNITLILKLENGMTWTISGMSVTADTLTDIDFNVMTDTDSIPENTIGELRGNNNATQFELAHNGAFGFEASLSMEMENATKGQDVELYYYNKETKEFELLDSSQVKEGRVNLTFVHASSYVVLTKGDEIEEETNNNADSNTTTVEPTMDTMKESVVFSGKEKNSPLFYILFGIIAIVGIGGGVIYRCKKKTKS